MNNENNNNQVNNQDTLPNITVNNDTNNIPLDDTSVTQPVPEQAPSNQVTPPPVQTPKVIKVENVKEVIKEVPQKDNKNKEEKTNTNQTPPPTNEVVVKEKGGFFGRFILFLFIMFLFAFVYYLPQISEYVENYKKEKSGVEDGSMRSGTMTCTFTKDNKDNLSTIYETTFSYTKNKLKKTEQITSYKLKDDATSTTTLDDSLKECENLKGALTNVDGVDISCAKTAVLQKTTQIIDYTKFDLNNFTTNIAEYQGFYPEYQLDQSIAAIKKNLEEAGYSCQSRDYDG
ncbi:hypothetical protein EGP98_01490 [bacterium]|nr:hypothetical protein [bacterium]